MKKRLAIWLLPAMMLMMFVPASASASAEGEPYALQVTVNGEGKYVRSYDGEYRGNR